MGIATEITLRILKTAESICVLLADFTSIEAAGAAVSDIISAGIIPAGMEMMDNISINAVEDVVATGCYPGDAEAILLVEIDGMEFAAAGHLSPDYYVQDGVIPRTQLPFVLQEIEDLSQKYGYRIANVFHAGDGNLHPLILYDNAVAGTLEQVEELGGEILKLYVSVGGSISREHGIGADERCYMPNMFTEADLETMQWVRQVFNPKGLANPGKIFPTPRTCGEAAMAGSAKQFDSVEQF